METNKTSIAGIALAVCAGVIASVALIVGLQRVSTLNVNVNADKPVNVSVKGSDQATGDEKVGATAGQVTYWTSGDFSDELNVQGNTITSGLNVTGNVTSTSLPTEKTVSYTASVSSQTFCSIRNTTGADRVLAFADLIYATSSATGGATQRFTVSQSSTASATGTGSQLYFDGFVTVPTNGVNNLVPTSTLSGTNGARDIWTAGSYINFLQASPTSTLRGSCRVVSF